MINDELFSPPSLSINDHGRTGTSTMAFNHPFHQVWQSSPNTTIISTGKNSYFLVSLLVFLKRRLVNHRSVQVPSIASSPCPRRNCRVEDQNLDRLQNRRRHQSAPVPANEATDPLPLISPSARARHSKLPHHSDRRSPPPSRASQKMADEIEYNVVSAHSQLRGRLNGPPRQPVPPSRASRSLSHPMPPPQKSLPI
jgi:hypothetical protein